MKGVIKVTAGWNAASLHLDSFSRLSLRVAFTSSVCPLSYCRLSVNPQTLFIIYAYHDYWNTYNYGLWFILLKADYGVNGGNLWS